MRIALFLPNWIGDVVMATPAIRALRERYPAAEIVGVCKPYVADVVAGSPWFDRLVPLDGRGPWRKQWLAVAWHLRRPDLSVLFTNTFRSALVARLAGSRRSIGFVRHGRGFLLTDRLRYRTDASGRLTPSPIIDDYNRLAITAGTGDPGYRMQLFATPADQAAAERVVERVGFRSDRETICLNPGAAFGAAKHWSVDAFAQLAQDLVDRRSSQVLVLCGPSEREMARQIVRLAARPGIASLADEAVSLGLTKALLRRATLLVTTDSGPRHFAAAFDRPVVSLFGPTHIEWTETYYARAVHLQKKVPCGPCQKRVCPLDHRCMTELSPDEVFAAVCRLLDVPRRAAS
jgi:lipopolysaccharide heptosyltransferase II